MEILTMKSTDYKKGRRPGFKLTEERKQQMAHTNTLNAIVRRAQREYQAMSDCNRCKIERQCRNVI